MKPHAAHLVTGLTLWLVWFCATYGGLALGCTWSPPEPGQGAATWLNAWLLVVAAGVTLACGVAAWRSHRRARSAAGRALGERDLFLLRAGTALYATAAVSTVAVALPVLLLAPCA